MNIKAHKISVFFMLFVFCGQLVASPFLNCRDMDWPSSNNTKTDSTKMKNADMNCQKMSMSASRAHHNIESALSSDTFDALHQGESHSLHNCDHLCQYCLGFSSVAAFHQANSEPLHLRSQLVPIVSDTLVTLSFDIHFRPPIAA